MNLNKRDTLSCVSRFARNKKTIYLVDFIITIRRIRFRLILNASRNDLNWRSFHTGNLQGIWISARNAIQTMVPESNAFAEGKVIFIGKFWTAAQ